MATGQQNVLHEAPSPDRLAPDEQSIDDGSVEEEPFIYRGSLDVPADGSLHAPNQLY